MNREVLVKVFEHAQVVDKWCAENGGVRVFTGLFGSQNYGVDNEYSDVDTKSIILPDHRDWVWGDLEKYNKVLTSNDGENIEMKNIVDMFKQFIKGNINFLEILYTEYVDIAPGWEWLYDELLQTRDNIARHNLYKQSLTWLGYLEQARVRAYDRAARKNEMNHKSVANALRIKESWIRYFQFNRPFDEAINVTDMRSTLMPIKNGYVDFQTELQICTDVALWRAKALEWTKNHFEDKEVFNAEVYLKELALEAMIAYFEEVCE